MPEYNTEINFDELPIISGALMRGKKCKFCGCTNGKACAGGCWWVQQDPPCCSSAKCIGKLIVERNTAAGRLL